MAARARFKKLTDLYVKRKEVQLPDGDVLHVRALNAFERDECLDAAQVARSRVIMAMREAGDERLKVQDRIGLVGHEEVSRELAEVRNDDDFPKIVNSVRDDPDWKERFAILERSDLENAASPPSDEEFALVTKINTEYFAEIDRRSKEELELKIQQNAQLTPDQLEEEYLEAWLEKKGRKAANDEYLLTEVYLATTWPDGERVFESKREVHDAPAGLFTQIAEALAELTMDTRDPKDSGSAPSSSDSSALPSEAAASGISTSEGIPTTLPGTSPQLSTTP